MNTNFDADISRGLEFVSGKPPSLVPREELIRIIRERRAAGYGAAYRNIRDDDPSCLGCLFSVGSGIYKMVTDFTGEKAKAEENRVFDNQVNNLAEGLKETIPVIGLGLKKMRDNVAGFVEALPEESVAKRLANVYDAGCFCGPFQLGDKQAVLLRGEIKEHIDNLRHRGGNIEEQFTQHACMVTTDGDIFKMELHGVSLASDREAKLGSAMPVRKYFEANIKEDNKQVEQQRKQTKENPKKPFFDQLAATLKEAKNSGKDVRLTPESQFYSNHQYKMIITMVDPSREKDQVELKKYLLASQQRALIVALELGRKEVKENEAKKMTVLFQDK